MADKAKPISRLLWLVLGVLAVMLGLIGAFLPILPTTPLMILAAFFFSKSSPRLEAMLLDHRTFGPIIAQWRETGSIARNIKFIAVGTMAGVFLLSLVLGVKTFVLVIQFICLGAAASYILTRPST